MNKNNLDALRQKSVKKLTGIYLDRLFGSNKVLAFNADAVNFTEDDRTLNSSDLTVSDAVLYEAKKQAERFAKSRNSKGTSPKSLAYASSEENKIVSDVKDWLSLRKLRGHGKRDQK